VPISSRSIALEDKGKEENTRRTGLIGRLSVVSKGKNKSKSRGKEVTRPTSLIGRIYIGTSLTSSIER